MVTDDGANTENTTKDIDAMKKMLAERFAGLDDAHDRSRHGRNERGNSAV